MSNNVQLLHDAKAIVGEGPNWDTRTGALWWVDILNCSVWRGDLDGPGESFQVPAHVGAVLPCADPAELLLVMRDGFHHRNAAGELTALATPLARTPHIRFNDAKCDPQGRAFGGTMAYEGGDGQAALYRLDASEATLVVPDMSLSNGLGWSPDGTLMYLTDSAKNRIDVFDFDSADGGLSGRRPFVQIPDGHGMPDGLCVDDDGCVWVALWGTGRIRRFTPQGQLERQIELPVSQPTSMCFAGTGLDTLVITSAAVGLTEEQLANEPFAGGLFTLEPGITGAAATPWQPISMPKSDS